jgi:L-alanine-DL-glutamate epimerase-like enolase superfamily enzyme
MTLDLRVHAERLPLRAPFRISRGVKTHAEVVVAEVRDGGFSGFGECVPYARYGETPASVCASLEEIGGKLAAGGDARVLAASMPPGAARNALDCALWDLEARRDGTSVADRLGVAAPSSVATAVTISLAEPDDMRAAAEAAAASAALLKVKLGADRPAERLLAVAEAAPRARLIVDPNEGWTPAILAAMAGPISRLQVAVVEQPLPSGADGALEGLAYPVPICADESAHTAADVERVAARYQMVNVKLDKAGGLTEALAMVERARSLGLGVMAGCMVSSSLAIAPALFLAAGADLVDLDGPWWLRDDRAGGCRLQGGTLLSPQRGFWGEPGLRP